MLSTHSRPEEQLKGNMRHHHSFLFSFSVWSWLEKMLVKGTTHYNRRQAEQLQGVEEEFKYYIGTEMENAFTSIVQFLPLGELQFPNSPWALLLKNRLRKISLLLPLLLLSFMSASCRLSTECPCSQRRSRFTSFASWLLLIKTYFGKLARPLLRPCTMQFKTADVLQDSANYCSVCSTRRKSQATGKWRICSPCRNFPFRNLWSDKVLL